MSLLKSYLTFNSDGSSEAQLKDIEKITIKKSESGRSNKCEFTLKNPIFNTDGTVDINSHIDATYNSKFSVLKSRAGTLITEQEIKAYAKYIDDNPTETINNTENLLFNGFLVVGIIKATQSSNKIILECQDRNFVLMNKVAVPQAYEISQAINAPEILKNVVRLASESPDSSLLAFTSSGVVQKGGQYLVDARLFSEGIKSSGTATSVSMRKLIDVGETFQTDGVEIGDWVRNTSTNEYAYVVSVDSETQLTLTKDIFTSTDAYQVSDGFIQDSRLDGSVFPDLAYNIIDKPIFDEVKELSSVEKTNSATEIGTGAYVIKRSARSFVDSRNRLHWYIPSDTPEYIMRHGTSEPISPDTVGHIIYKFDLKNSVDGTVNYIIFKAGEDMDNDQIKGFRYKQFSGTPLLNDALRHYENISLFMKIQDYQAGNLTFSEGTQYNYPSSYPLTPVWDSEARSVGTDEEYNNNFSEEAIRRAYARADKEFIKLANPRLKGSIMVKGYNYSVGDLIRFTSYEHGIISAKLRIDSISHTIDAKQGWITNLEVEEDEPEITV